MNTDFAKSLGILPLSYIEFRSFVKKSIPMSSRTANTSIAIIVKQLPLPKYILPLLLFPTSFRRQVGTAARLNM